jgi:hypothetical protein
MKKTILTILIGLFFLTGFSQQTYQYRYHIFDDYLLNPAYVGSGNYYSALLARDQRFYGLSNSSPTTYFLSAHSKLGKGYLFAKDGKINKFFGQFGNVAVGFQFLQYTYGPNEETNVGLTYGYHLNLAPNSMTKSPRKVVLAFTPRLQRVGFNLNKLGLLNIDGQLVTDDENDYLSMANINKVASWFFTTDLGALYQTKHVDVGIGGISLIPYKNSLETDSLYLEDATVYTYDHLYSTKLMANLKVKFLTMHESSKFDLDFIPAFSALYAPKTGHSEFYLDLKFDGYFKKHIAGIRSKVIFNSQLGVNIQYINTYTDDHLSMLNPYIVFDFKNYAITFMQSLYLNNDIISVPGISGGGQISILLKIGNDRIVRKTSAQNTWK